MKRRWMALALTLPIAGLLASVLWHGWQIRSASEWRIPVAGYDPRDLLAGHYAQFRFGWRVGGRPQLCSSGDCAFCLEKREGAVVANVVPRDADCDNKVDPRKSDISVVWPGETSADGLVAASRIYIPEGEAERITRVLASGRGVLVARLGKDRRLSAVRIDELDGAIR